MNIQLWFCPSMNQWRWTVTKNDRTIVQQESGQNLNLKSAMEDIEKIVEYLK